MKTKSQIELHANGSRPARPAVNVKDHQSWRALSEIKAHFRCCDKTAEMARQYAWEAHAEMFWETAQESCDHFLGKGYKVYSEGRQGGWLVVEGLPNIESWDAIRVSAWHRFADAQRQTVDWLTSAEALIESIEANDWAKADALLDDADAEAEESEAMACRGVVTI